MRNHLTILVATLAYCLTSADAGELLFADNFDAPDTNNLDLSDQAGRRSGSNTQIQVRSSRIQHGIASNQLNFLNSRTGRIRFHDDLDGDNNTAETWHDWASGADGVKILDEGGFRVEFDWIAGNDTSNNWISMNVGISGPGVPEPGFRVNHAETDIGILFRFNGQTELFDNGANQGAQGSFNPTVGARRVTIDYLFDSFADGSPVTMTASVDGTEVFNGGGFTWDNNGSAFYMELENLESTLIDNLSISGVSTEGFFLSAQAVDFLSSAPDGTPVATLSGALDGTPEPTTFSLVAGEGDTDNPKFQIVGDQLQLGAGFDFLNEPDGSTYSVRIGGTGNDSGESGELTFTLMLVADADADTLPDSFELGATDAGEGGNLVDLDGNAAGPGPGSGTGDFDGDALSDREEYDLNVAGTAVDPTDADTDDDDLEDGAEIAGAGDRGPTDPADADSDDDALSDGQESNSGTFVDADDTGSDPNDPDTDADGFRDFFDTLHGGDPTDPGAAPQSSPDISLVALTDDVSSGIDADKTYTHTISGGGAASVNGVEFETMTPTLLPPNLLWDTGGLTMSQVAATNNGDWDPALGGVTGPGLLGLFGGFTYSSNGANSGAGQRFTLSGLTVGQSYTLRLYVRLWDTEGSGRPIDLSFNNGGALSVAPLLEDRPQIMLGGAATEHEAYAVEYTYTAASSDLIITAEVPAGSAAPSGSYHLYGLSNEEGGAPQVPTITSIIRHPESGNVTITFDSQPGVEYAIDYSTSLKATNTPGGWTELTDGAPSGGTSTSFVDEIIAPTGPPRVFYRVRIP